MGVETLIYIIYTVGQGRHKTHKKMACVCVRNVFKLCNCILSNFQCTQLTLSCPLSVSAACYLREGTEMEYNDKSKRTATLPPKIT